MAARRCSPRGASSPSSRVEGRQPPGDLAAVLQPVPFTLAQLPGPLGAAFSTAGKPLRPRLEGVAASTLFPLPTVPLAAPARGRHRLRALRRRLLVSLVNIWVVILNWMHAGGGSMCGTHAASAAQQRVLDALAARVRDSLRRSTLQRPSREAFREFAKLDDSACLRGPVAVPLDSSAGIPDRAAACDVAVVLAGHEPALAAVAADPVRVLLPSSEWPPLRRPFSYIRGDYGALIDRAAAAGLVEDAPAEDLHIVDGRVAYGGAFAVPKDGKETKWIAPSEFVNDVTDKRRVPLTVLPYLPQLAGLTFKPGERARVSKRDARCYFHNMKARHCWRSFQCLPPVIVKGKARRYPKYRTWPMGSRISAALAQGLSNVVTKLAGVPEKHRLLPGRPCPLRLPVRGSIIDDFWVFHGEHDPVTEDEATHWSDRVVDQW